MVDSEEMVLHEGPPMKVTLTKWKGEEVRFSIAAHHESGYMLTHFYTREQVKDVLGVYMHVDGVKEFIDEVV